MVPHDQVRCSASELCPLLEKAQRSQDRSTSGELHALKFMSVGTLYVVFLRSCMMQLLLRTLKSSVQGRWPGIVLYCLFIYGFSRGKWTLIMGVMGAL